MPLAEAVIDPNMVRPRAFLGPVGVWAVMAIVAVLNGIIREKFLVASLGEHRGHLLSTAILVVAILLISSTYFQRTETAFSRLELLLIGVEWTMLTVGFEFLVGYLEGTPVSTTIAQYDVTAGQVWIAVPITLLVSPLLFGWFLSA